MTASGYILRSLLHHRFAYAGVLAGATLGAMVLFGALFAGDSVAESLRRIGEARTGRATHLLTAGDRLFREALAGDLAGTAGVRVAPVLLARGTAVGGPAQAAANQVQLVGVTDAFWTFAPQPAPVVLDAAGSSVAVNDTMANRLGLSVGDTLIIRLQKPGVLAGNAPVAGAESSLESLRCSVAAVLDDDAFGRFGLEASQVPRPSIFLPIGLLQERLSQSERANVLLIDAGASGDGLESALRSAMRLPDYALELKWLEGAAVFEITSNRVFIDPELAGAIVDSVPEAGRIVSYLVNEFRAGERSTPYSIATATSHRTAPFLPADLGSGEIVLNAWLADDLQAAAGDEVRLTYFQSGPAGALVEADATFRVRSIVPLEGLAADGAWMPDFPGISDADNTSDWDPGLPLNLDLIRDQDERYWDAYRGTPKAFISEAAGLNIWSTRWGDSTALRIPYEQSREAELEAALLAALRPELNQLVLRDFRASAMEAASSPVDFGGLFIGMSFFLILAALGLVAMLFQFILLQRNREGALLGSVGVPPGRIMRWRLAEGLVILVIGCAAGLPLAVVYTKLILRFLDSIWAGQSAAATFVFAASPASIATGCAAFLGLSLLAIWLAIRKQARRALSIRLTTNIEETAATPRQRRTSLIITVTAVGIALAAIALSGRAMPAQGAFYLGGFALLVAGVALCRYWLSRDANGTDAQPDAARLGVLNLKARRSRSLTVVGLIASAVFMVLSVASFRKHVGDGWTERGSGTGGFAFWMETTSAVNAARDGSSRGFEMFEAHAAALGEIVPIRAGVGDNANCFNLNTTAQPQLLALNASQLAARDAFTIKLADTTSGAAGWDALRAETADGTIPAFVDETTLMWALKRKAGDVLTYADENGRDFNVRIAGVIPDSVFQGYLVVDEEAFLKRFPSNPGYSIFLIDADAAADHEELRSRLERSAIDAGGRVVLTREILESFHRIENTYIAIFHVLGALGVILGSLGLVLVVARNIRERRGEFVVMSAIGIPANVVARMVYSEFSRLVFWGMAIGVLAALVSVIPNFAGLPAGPAAALVIVLLAGILALNLAVGRWVFWWTFGKLEPSLKSVAQ